MTVSNALPSKCMECMKSNASLIHRNCKFCKEIEFQESVLCDLNRCIQNISDFECSAFQPKLKLVSPSKDHVAACDDTVAYKINKKRFPELLNSDKIKYERALAFQKLSLDPEGAYIQLKYHFVWNVSFRRSVFHPVSEYFDFVSDAFLGCSKQVRGFVNLLYLAPDHIHLYVESDGELSIEEMVCRIKQSANDSILNKFSLIADRLGSGSDIWDEAYFAETIG